MLPDRQLFRIILEVAEKEFEEGRKYGSVLPEVSLTIGLRDFGATATLNESTVKVLVDALGDNTQAERIRLLTENVRQRDEMIASLRAQLEKRATDRPPAPEAPEGCVDHGPNGSGC